jgi:hypothetical protein
VYFFTFLARPLVNAACDGDPAGAYVNCWVDLPTREAAESRARQVIAEFPWHLEALELCRLVSESDYPDSRSERDYFDQARADGHCVVFHVWPSAGDAEDG